MPGDFESLVGFRSREDVTALLRIGFYNIRHGEGLDGKVDLERIADVMRETEIACFSEVDDGWPRSGWMNQAYALAASLRMPHYRYAPALERGHVRDGEDVRSRYGNLLASKYPIVTTDVLPLPAGSGEPRVAIAAGIAVDGRVLRILVTHLGLTDADQQIQAEAIAAYLGNDPVDVLLGDLNAEWGAPSLTPLVDAAQWALPCSPNDLPKTFPADNPERAIDHIWIRSEIASQVVKFETVQSAASDHFPVFLTLRW